MRAALRRALLGLVLGIVSGGLALMIAVGRTTLVQGGGRGPGLIAEQHPALMPSFLVAFGLGGALLGLSAPLRRTAIGALALGLIAASGFVATIFVGLAGPPAGWSRSTWWVVGTATLLVGAVLGGQLQPSDTGSA